MKACSSASGGVIFVPDEMEKETKSVSYREFIEQEEASEKTGVFGKRRRNFPQSSDEAQVA